MAYYGTSYEAAKYDADTSNYNDTVALINATTSAYNGIINESVVLFNEGGSLQARARAVNHIGIWGASIALSSKSKKKVDSAFVKVEEAKALLENISFKYYDVVSVIRVIGYMQGGAPIYKIYYQTIIGTRVRSYTEAVSYANNLASFLAGYTSWSFSFSLGNGLYSLLTAENITFLVNLTLSTINDFGLISDNTYRRILSNPLWQLAINVAVSKAVSYGLSNSGFVNTLFGNVDKATAQKVYTPEVRSVFGAINAISTIYSIYKVFSDDTNRDSVIEHNTTTTKLQDFRDTDVYEDNEYYKTFAGQELFNIGMPGHDGYVPASAQTPSWGIVGEAAHNEDVFMSQIMNQNRNETMAGGSGYLNTITEGTIKINR